MSKRNYLLICCMFLLTACSHHKQPSVTPLKSPSSATQYRTLPTFSQVDIQGSINARVHTGYKKPLVVLKGDPRDLAQVKAMVDGTTLYLALGSGYPRFGAVDADIQGLFLNRLTYKGAGLLTGSQLHTQFLELYLANQGTTQLGGSIGLQVLEVSGSGVTQISGITSHDLRIQLKGDPKVQLTGTATLSKLNIDGNGWLSLYWVKSNELLIRAKKAAKIQLAGVVNRLDVELWDNAQFKGRYLRALRSFVKTHGRSRAEISAVDHQSDLATDASDIFYFNLPQTRGDFMAFNGSILDMREWNQYDLPEPTRYNKHYP